ncbi:MAG: rod shape-determining protein MreD [Firmicutes bacterium]|nr:rod shape-determining protein MreD [Bacillota bacterium]
MRAAFWFVLVLILLVIQATILPLLFTGGHRPDLLLAAVVSAGLLFGKDTAIGLGFFAGLLQDLASGAIFGLNLLPKMLTGYLFGLAERNVFKENILLPLFAVMAATVFQGLFTMFFLLLSGYPMDMFAYFIQQVIPAAFYNMLTAIPIHYAIYFYSRRLAQPV